MKRDLDLIRELMLKLEALRVSPGGLVSFSSGDPEIAIEGRTQDELDGHLYMIYDAGFVVSDDSGAGRMMSGDWMFRRLSPAGHDFLDAVRDPGVWSKTKDGALKLGGWTLPILVELAKAYLRRLAKERLGLDL